MKRKIFTVLAIIAGLATTFEIIMSLSNGVVGIPIAIKTILVCLFAYYVFRTFKPSKKTDPKSISQKPSANDGPI